MTKTDGSLIGGQLVLNFEHSDFGIVSDFGFRYSDFMAIPAPVEWNGRPAFQPRPGGIFATLRL
jgi:hypothetical protein